MFPGLSAAGGGDPFAPTEAERLAAVVHGRRETVLLAERGVTVETWPTWKEAAGGGSEAAAIVVAAIDSGIGIEDLDRLPAGGIGPYARLTMRRDGGEGPVVYDGRAVVAWAKAHPHLEPVDIVGLISVGLTPDAAAWQDLAAAGVPPELAAGWHVSGRDAEHAAAWATLGVPANEAAQLEVHDVTAGDLADAAAAMPASYPGPAGDRMFLRRAGRLAMWAAGVTELEAAAYADAGTVGVAAGLLARFGVTPDDYAAYADTAGGGFGFNRVSRVPADLVVECARAGATPADAAAWRRCGLSTGGWVAAARSGAVGEAVYDTLLAPGSRTLGRALESSDLPDAEALKILHRTDRAANGRPVAFAFATRSDSCPPRLMAAAAADPDNPARFDVAAGGAQRLAADPDLLAVAAVAPSVETRVNAARHPNTRPVTLTDLAADPHPEVRAAAAANPNLPAAGVAAGGLLAD